MSHVSPTSTMLKFPKTPLVEVHPSISFLLASQTLWRWLLEDAC
jgi:hypothetical protein